ncbi:MAG: hypothetical protein ACK4Z9_00895 [Thermodesulfovibrionales bacterium]
MPGFSVVSSRTETWDIVSIQKTEDRHPEARVCLLSSASLSSVFCQEFTVSSCSPRVLIGFSDEIMESRDDKKGTEPACSSVPDITSLSGAGFPVILGVIIMGISISRIKYNNYAICRVIE